MKHNVDLFIVFRYERWSAYWFKEVLNYIIVTDSVKVIAEYNSRNKTIAIDQNEKRFVIQFVSRTHFEQLMGYHDCRVINWEDGNVEKLYLKIKEAVNG